MYPGRSGSTGSSRVAREPSDGKLSEPMGLLPVVM
jgi:hypothetical protein